MAGYADSEGAQNEDRVRPNMWRYRDYVVRAFNSDKPYDLFLAEQLAGDELTDYENASEITPETYDQLAATGFLRCTPDRTFADITNFVPDRLELIADEIQVFSSAVLGLTINCARCHSHKFDPLPQRDYYRLAAVFKDAFDEHDWLKPESRTLPFVTTEERTAWEAREQRLDRMVARLQPQLEAAEEDAARQRIEGKIASVEAQRRPEPQIRALWSRGVPSPTYLLQRGDYRRPGQVVEPGPPSVLAPAGTMFEVNPPRDDASSTGRRLALAHWATQDDHPLTARVMVNRIWRHHFGAGLVATLDNFGTTGSPPTHPELLDWLAVEFVRRDWSIKDIHRLIVTSRTYRQTSIASAESVEHDPEGRWLSRMPLRRLEGEPLRDALFFVAGRLDLTPFGPPDDVDARDDGLVTSLPTDAGWRRSVFVLQRRTRLPTILDSFDAPQMTPNCLERRTSVVAPQALHLLNDATVHELAGSFADRVRMGCNDDRSAQIVRIHELAYGRQPSTEEMRLVEQALDQLSDAWLQAGPESAPPSNDGNRSRASRTAELLSRRYEFGRIRAC